MNGEEDPKKEQYYVTIYTPGYASKEYIEACKQRRMLSEHQLRMEDKYQYLSTLFEEFEAEPEDEGEVYVREQLLKLLEFPDKTLREFYTELIEDRRIEDIRK